MEVNTIIKAQHSSYQTRADEYNNLWVLNSLNVLTYAVPKNLNYKFNDQFQFQATAQAFKEALGKERLQDLGDKKEGISLTYWLSPEGKILEIEFIIKTNTTLSIEEIETVENALKASLSFNLTWTDDQEADFASMNTFFSFGDLIVFLDPSTAGSVHTKITRITLTPPPLPGLD